MELAKKIQTGSIPKLIFGLSAPAILSLLLNALNTAIDGMFVGTGLVPLHFRRSLYPSELS